MITAYTITGATWTAITSAGQNGACWLDEEGDGSSGAADVRITHSTTGTPISAAVTSAKKIHKPSGNNDICKFTADSALDIYYARCVNTNDQAIIIADTEDGIWV